MSKLRKYLPLIISLLVGIPIIIIILLITLIDPNQYKSQITSAASSNLNRKVEIDGDLEWSIYPLGITINKLNIENDPKFQAQNKYMVSSDVATISLEILPLLRKSFKVDHLHLENPVINLAKDNKDFTNWQTISSPPSKKTSKKKNKAVKKEASTEAQPTMYPDLNIKEIDIINGTLNWQAPGKNITLRNFNLESYNLNTRNSPAKIEGSYILNIQSAKLNIYNSFKATLNLQQKPIMAKIDFSKLNIKLSKDSSPDRYFLDLQSNNKYSNQVSFENNILTTKANFNTFGGTASIDSSVNLKPLIPTYEGNLDLSNISMTSLLNSLTGSSSLSGNTNFKLNYKTKGADASALIKSLNGDASFDLSGGTLDGVDIDQLLDLLTSKIKVDATDILGSVGSTLSFVGNILSTVVGTNMSTNIGSMSATAKITNGGINNNDLKMVTPGAFAYGQGRVNLPSESINYTLTLSHRKSGSEQETDLNVPIKITGNMYNPKYDAGVPTGSLVTDSVKSLTKTLKKNVPGLEKTLEKLPIKDLDKLFGF